MEIGLLHNMQILIDLYSTIGAIRYVFPTASSVVTLLIAVLTHVSFEAMHHGNFSVTVFVVLAEVANTVFLVLLWMFRKWSKSRLCAQARRPRLLCVAGFLSFAAGYIAARGPSLDVGKVASLSLPLFCMFLLCTPNKSHRTSRFGTWLFPLFFPMVMSEWLATEFSASWKYLLWVSPICLRLFLEDASEPKSVSIMRCCLIVYGVWDNLTSRHERRLQQFPTYTPLLCFMALLDLAVAPAARRSCMLDRSG